MTTYLPIRSAPRRCALDATGRNGLDYVEVVDGPTSTQLFVYFLGKTSGGIQRKKTELKRYLQLTGGDRITGLKILDVTPQAGIDAEHDDYLVVTVDQVGDFSTYTLSLVGVEGIDPQYASASFTFRMDCAADLDCKSSCDLPADGAGRTDDQLPRQGLRQLPATDTGSHGAAGARVDRTPRAGHRRDAGRTARVRRRQPELLPGCRGHRGVSGYGAPAHIGAPPRATRRLSPARRLQCTCMGADRSERCCSIATGANWFRHGNKRCPRHTTVHA